MSNIVKSFAICGLAGLALAACSQEENNITTPEATETAVVPMPGPTETAVVPVPVPGATETEVVPGPTVTETATPAPTP